MAFALDATVGGTSANSYISLANAELYFEERLNVTNWSSATDDNKGKALVMATRRIDQERFEGEKVASAQALKWPRYWALDDNGDEFASNEIPTIVEHATCELALRILNDGTTDFYADDGLERFNRAKIGPIDVEIRHGHSAAELPEVVLNLLRPVILSSGYSAKLLRA